MNKGKFMKRMFVRNTGTILPGKEMRMEILLHKYPKFNDKVFLFVGLTTLGNHIEF